MTIISLAVLLGINFFNEVTAMPNPGFNEAFYTAYSDSSRDILDYTALYGTSALAYFEPNLLEESTLNQLTQFQQSSMFPYFKQQYNRLIYALNQWCIDHNICYLTKDDLFPKNEEKAAFLLFQDRLWGDLDYYSIRKAILFNDSKKNLEELLLFLYDRTTPMHLKLKIMKHLQKSIVACADATLNNITDAKDDLKAARSGISFLRENTLRTLIQQYALHYVWFVYNETGGEEIHYANAFSNYVASSYGIPLKQDNFITSLHIPSWQLEQFAEQVDELLTPEVALRAMLYFLEERLATMQTNFQTRFFKDQKTLPFAHYVTLQPDAERLLESWNKQYALLLPLSLDVFLKFNEDETALIPAVYNKAHYHKIIAEQFSALFLQNSSQKHSYSFQKHTVVVHNGLIWLEQGSLISEFHSAALPIPTTNLVADYQFINKALEARPEYASQWVAKIQINPCQLLQWNCDLILNAMITHRALTKRQQQAIQSSEFGASINTHLSKLKRFELLERLLAHNLLSKQVLSIVWPTVISVYGKEQLNFVAQLLIKNLLNTQILSQTASEAPEFIGINSIFLLAYGKRFASLNEILKQKRLSPQVFECAFHQGPLAGQNVFWLLVMAFEQVKKQLKAIPEREHHTKRYSSLKNNLHLLKNIMERLLDQNLISSTLLSANRQNPALADTNAVYILATQGDFHFIEKLLDKKLLTSELIAVAPNNKSLLLELATQNQFKLLVKLLNNNLLTTEVLAPNKSAVIQELGLKQQRSLLQKMLAKGLISEQELPREPRRTRQTPWYSMFVTEPRNPLSQLWRLPGP